ncbi:MAG: hypothetical protein AAF399_14340 [Bacteroidota bacterium]
MWAEWEERQAYVQQLGAILVEAIPNPPSVESVWNRLYPEQPFNDARFRKLLRDVLTKLEEFISIQSFRRQRELQPVCYLRELLNMNEPELFEKSYRKAQKQLHAQPFRGADYFRARFELEQLNQRFWGLYSNRKEQPDDSASRLMFDHWWMTERMNHALVELSIQPKSLPDQDVQFILNRLKEEAGSTSKPAVLWIYTQLYRFLVGIETEAIDLADLQSEIIAHEQAFRESDLNAMFTLLRNQYIRLLQVKRENRVGRQLLQLYQWGLEKGWMLNHGFLGWDQYKNIQTICLWLEEYDLAELYLAQLTPLLREELQEDAHAFNQANYHFAKGNYDAVVVGLRGRKFTVLSIELPARLMLLQAVYERNPDEEEWLLGQLDSASKFLRNKEMAKRSKMSYQHFLRLTRKLIQVRSGAQLEKVTREIKETTPMFQKKWLIQKAAAKRSGSA